MTGMKRFQSNIAMVSQQIYADVTGCDVKRVIYLYRQNIAKHYNGKKMLTDIAFSTTTYFFPITEAYPFTVLHIGL